MTELRPVSAVFLDRDGILNEYLPRDYVKTIDELRVIPGVARAVRKLNRARKKVIVVSNQQGVGKGVMAQSDLIVVEVELRRRINDEAGAVLDACYYCTDLAGSESLRRKPKPGMLIEAAADFGFDLADAVMVGDSSTDIGAGKAAGVRSTFLVLSGSIREYAPGDMDPAPDYVCADLNEAVNRILEA